MKDLSPEQTAQIDRRLQKLALDVEPPAMVWTNVSRGLSPRIDPITSVAARLANEVPPPDGLWARIREDIERSPRGAAPTPRFEMPLIDIAAALAAASVVAIAAIFAFSLGRLPDDGSPALPQLQALAGGAPVWPTQFTELRGDADESSSTSYLRSITDAMRQDFEAVRSERLAIEASIRDDFENPDLRELWRLAYQAELRLIDEAGRLMDTLERGLEI